MKKIFITLLLILASISCRNNSQRQPSFITSTSQVSEIPPAEGQADWAIYDPDPDHIWNRVFHQLYRRTDAEGIEHGADELDPLLWFDTTYLLNGKSHKEALGVLDEFLNSHAEDLTTDPLKRAMFQRDMWTVFDWAASQTNPHPTERQALMSRLAQVIKSVALSKAEIQLLPDNYAHAVRSKIFPDHFQGDHPENAFLPLDLFQVDGAWVPIGREGGPVAMTHTSSFPFFGHSVFLVFVRSSENRTGTLDFIDSLNTEANPVLAVGADVALVRKMLLIDEDGDLQPSPLVETIQLRHFNPKQSFYEFELDRTRLFNDIEGGLILNKDVFLLFMSHGDVFEKHVTEQKAAIPEICKACHFEISTRPVSANTNSIISYSRNPVPLTDNTQPILFATTISKEIQTVMQWKLAHETWGSLKVLWDQERP